MHVHRARNENKALTRYMMHVLCLENLNKSLTEVHKNYLSNKDKFFTQMHDSYVYII